MRLPSYLFRLVLLCFATFGSNIILADPVWIDVRSKIEHTFDHIDGDLRATHNEIVPIVSRQYPDKNTEIVVYCARGVRAEKAKNALIAAGYSRVTNAGGIDDVRQKRNISTD
ncbi:hypothetical protein A3752_05365 [Oleiphilus sp. HI0081]|jgi:phage shock protein E|nr:MULTISPECIES: rhodanese-like domain-containing protein [unclassified Oleiphilus]KZY42707.1 hypothetical protein A3732_15810 [Oleiphilus sp. HI0050]KZY74020.1 hypothetical protein A3740_17770 [Oleiphilus sp. HI0068]KZY77755.1 hypothetical protein A3741_22290 [Oleiphilus sp. HI0069]KZY84974.1 hypothetical protein A3743_03585 [Oleiphilus sp. HI0072]KZZ12472.1 hypothetical protein A3749_06290 [Oleiphilus sp. HI0078]KZZ23958.1 hypothetical protein A3752_05365 [Oleiphilus sp. HI0081]KZZ35322.1 